MSTVLTPQFIQEVAYAVHDEVANRRDPIIPDRRAYPLWSFLMNRRKERTFTGGKTIIKMQKDGGLQTEHWDGRQVLSFQENRVDTCILMRTSLIRRPPRTMKGASRTVTGPASPLRRVSRSTSYGTTVGRASKSWSNASLTPTTAKAS